MARIRTIKPEFWQHPKTAKTSRDARLLFVGLLNEADDEGRMRYSAKRLSGVLFPFDDDATPDLVDSWVGELEVAGLVYRFDVEAASYLTLPGFMEHQRISKPRPSVLPTPPPRTVAEPSRNGRGGNGNGMGMEQGMEVEHVAPLPRRAEAARSRDLIWETLLEVCSINGVISPSARGAYNRARADLAACDATPETIRQRAAVFRVRWPNVSLTPTALSRRWSECEPNVEHLPAKKLTAQDVRLERAMREAEAKDRAEEWSET